MTQDNNTTPQGPVPSPGDPIRQFIEFQTNLREVMQHIGRSATEFQEQLRSVIGIPQLINEGLQEAFRLQGDIHHALQSTESLREFVKQTSEASKAVEQGVSSIAQAQIRAHEEIRQALRPALEFRNAMVHNFQISNTVVQNSFKEFFDLQAQIQDAIRLTVQPALLVHEEIRRSLALFQQLRVSAEISHLLLPKIQEVVHELGTKIEVKPTGMFQADGVDIEIDQVNRRIDEFLRRGEEFAELVRGQRSIEQQIDSIFRYIRKLDSPIRLIIFQLVLPVILNIV